MTRIDFQLPDVGEGVDAADVLEWRVAEGEAVREHEPLVEVQTDKVTVEIPAPVTGTLVRRGVAAGESVAVGGLLAVLESEQPEGPGRDREEPTRDRDTAPEPEPNPDGVAEPRPKPAGVDRSGPSRDGVAARPLAAPTTRRLARDSGVDLAAITGSGPHGRILREDVERAAAARPTAADETARAGAPSRAGRGTTAPAAAEDEVVALGGMRRSIARALTSAWQTVPHVTDYREVDATALLAIRHRLRDQARRRGQEDLAHALTPTPLLVKIAAVALAAHPHVNASIDMAREQITLHGRRNIGIATATDEGLVVPVVRDVDRYSIAEVALEIVRLTEAARAQRLRPEDLADGTFTVNNYGGLGIWLGTPIVKPPQVANLGVGAVRDQVVAVDGQPVVRPTLALAVSGDHRLLDGHTLAAFVTDVVRLIEAPDLLLGSLR